MSDENKQQFDFWIGTTSKQTPSIGHGKVPKMMAKHGKQFGSFIINANLSKLAEQNKKVKIRRTCQFLISTI